MSQERRKKIEGEVAAWREATRRGDRADPGSADEAEADVDAERHHSEYDKLTDEARDEQRREEAQGGRRPSPTSN